MLPTYYNHDLPWVLNFGRRPRPILLLVPVLRLLRVWIRNRQWVVFQPSLRHSVIRIGYALWCGFIPVFGLYGGGIRHLGGVHPVIWLGVGRVVDELRRLWREASNSSSSSNSCECVKQRALLCTW